MARKLFLDKEAQQINSFDERFYTMDNKTFYPSVTSVLQTYPKGEYFEKWLMDTGRNANKIKEDAGIQGTNVHNAIDFYLKGGELNMMDFDGREFFTLNEWKMICRFMDFFSYDGINRSTMEIEQILFSVIMKLGGTGDLVVEIDNENWMIDHKTSNALHYTYKIQLAVYKTMWELMNPGKKIDRYGVLWLNAKTRTKKDFTQGRGWQIKEYTESYDKDMAIYKATRTIWDNENPNPQPRNLTMPNTFKWKK
jgi:hypothetical protein